MFKNLKIGGLSQIGQAIVTGDLSKRDEIGQLYAKERLAKITPVLQKVASGDFSVNLEIPEEEDEFTEHLVALNLMIDDLREIAEENRTKTKELGKAKAGLEEEVANRTKELQAKVAELERFNKLAVGRELKMVELKEEIAKLNARFKDSGIKTADKQSRVTQIKVDDTGVSQQQVTTSKTDSEESGAGNEEPATIEEAQVAKAVEKAKEEQVASNGTIEQ